MAVRQTPGRFRYFTSVLGYSTTIAGTLTIIPTVGLLPVKFITGLVSDRLIVMSEASLPTVNPPILFTIRKQMTT